MSQALTISQSNDDFFKTLATHQGKGETPKPVYVRLDGKTGVWNELVFNETEKKNDKTPFLGGGDWKGAILLVKWFAKSKYKEGANKIKRTREFNDFRLDEVEYLEIDYKDKENGTKVLGKYENYTQFKEAMQIEYGKAVQEAIEKKEPIPAQADFMPELFGSIYIYNFDLNRVVNVKVKGKSRSALFDYLSGWRRGIEADSISQVLTSFSSVHFTDPQPYYATKFRADSVLPSDYQTKVKEAVLATLSWMKSFKEDSEGGSLEASLVEKDEGSYQEQVIDVGIKSDGEEIRLEDIPF